MDHPEPKVRRILAAIDGSDDARLALEAAARLSAATQACLDAICVVPTIPAFDKHAELARPLVEALRADAEASVHEAGARARSLGAIDIREHVREGDPADEICTVAREGHDLVVLGSRGLSTRTMHRVGSVSYNVAQHSPAPVLLVRGSADLARVIATIDGSAASARAARFAALFARLADTRLVLLYVIPSATEEVKFTVTRAVAEPFLGPLAGRIEAAGVPVAKRVEYGRPAQVVLRIAEQTRADLLVTGRSGMNGPLGFTLGGVTDKLLHSANASLLVVP